MQIFNLKFTAKQLGKSSQKCLREEKSERLRVKKAIEQGNLDIAKIYAQNAIRKKNEAVSYVRLQAQLDAVVSRLDSQAKMSSVSNSIASITKSLESAVASNNLERVAATMEKFEGAFENLDLQTQFVEGAMTSQAAQSTPENEVNALLQQVADEHGLELQSALPQGPTAVPATRVAAPNSDLTDRLSQLRNG